MARSGWPLFSSVLLMVCTLTAKASVHNCHLEKVLGNEDFSVSCGYQNKQIEVVVRCGKAKLDDNSWSRRFPPDKLDLWNVGTIRFSNCQVPERLSLFNEVVRSLNISFIDTLCFDNLRSSLSRRNLGGFSVRVFKIIRASFRELPSDMLHDVSDIKNFSIEETELTSIPVGFFGDWSRNLQNISFINNTLRRIGRHDLSRLEEAQNLWLTYNEISEIELGAFDELPNLRTLDISSNHMRGIPANLFRRLAKIEAIHAGLNRFDQLPARLLTGIENAQHLTRFRMSYNNGSLRSLPSGFFRNLSSLIFVELLHNQFTSLPGNLFAGATGLEQLNISENNLTTLPAGIFDDTRKLVDLRIIDNQLDYLPEGIFRGLTDLERLYLNRNRLTNISSNILEGIDSVKIFQAAWNNISHIDSNFCQYVKVIQEINLMGNQLTLELFPGVSVMINCLFLKELVVSYNKISQIFVDWIQSTTLELIDLQYNEITEFGVFQLHLLRSGLTIFLQNNKISTIDLRELEDETENYRSLNSLNSDKEIKVYLGNNPLNCDCRLVDFFRYFENKLDRSVKGYVEIYADLIGSERKVNVGFEGFKCAEPRELASRKMVDIKSEDLNCLVESDKKDDACNNTCFCREYPEKQLLSVDCSNNNLTKLPISIANEHGWSIELDVSRNKLIQTPSLVSSSYLLNVTSLDLSGNNISTVTADVFSSKLRELKLHNNSISRLEQKIIDYLAEDKVISKLTLHDNRWECNCQARNFLSLVQKKLTSHELHEIMCYGTDRRLSTMTVNELCEGAIAIIVGASLLIAFFGVIVGSLAALYYRYQKEIKVWLYSKQWCLWFVTEDELDKDKKFDAFISFSHKDEDFVEKEIIAKLEEGPRPYKLCLHYRDWLAGEWIPVQISRSVEESRRTVVILSPNFLESVWGRMEFRAAHTQALKEGRVRLIVVLYGEIGNVNDLDPELKSYLSLNTYVKWGDPWFWDKLRYALPHRYESSKRKTRNARIIENHLAQVPVSNGGTAAVPGKAEIIPMPKLTTTSTNDSVKLLDSSAEDERMIASC